MFTGACLLAALVVSQDATQLPAPLPDAPPPAVTQFEPAPPVVGGVVVLPPDVADQLLDFDTEKVMEVQKDAVQVRVMGSGRVGRLRIRDVKTPVVGRHRRVLTWPQFYEHVGRPDLAKQWARLTLGSSSLSLGGMALSFGSGLPFMAAMALGLGLIFYDHSPRGGGNASNRAVTPLLAVGIGTILAGAAVMTLMILGGSGLLWFSREMPDQPLDTADIMELAREHNNLVLSNAGFPESAGPALQ